MTEQPRKARTRADVRREVRVESGADTRQLLEQAVGLHRAGELARAVGLYEEVLRQEPERADALQYLGLARFQLGDSERAVALIREAISLRPAVAAYHDNLGSAHEARGELEEALEAYAEAERLEAGNADRSFNVAVVLQRLGRGAEAEAAYRAAISLRPGDADFHYHLGNLLKSRGNLRAAEGAYRAALEHRPEAAPIWTNLGNTLRAMERGAEAAEAYRAALRASPRDVLAHLNLGHSLRERDDPAQARSCYAAAVALDPGLLEARLSLAGVELALGRDAEALESYLAALGAHPESAEARRGLAALARTVLPRGHRPAFSRALLACIADPRVQAQDLAAAAAGQIVAKHRLQQAPADVAALAGRLAAEPLLVELLERTINVDAVLEAQLVRVRGHFLASPQPLEPPDTPALRRLLVGLARQCFANEYVYPESDVEAGVLAALGERLAAASCAGALDAASQWAFARIAMYREPAGLECVEALAAMPLSGWAAELRDLVTVTVAEPLEERALAGELAALADIEDPVSVAVREQYEANPYPRWFAVPEREPIGYRDYLRRRFPHARLPDFLDGEVHVLAAGCGTGQEAVAIARTRARARVVGLDLSRRSLAYASRMARKLEVANVRFVHADLAHAARLGQRFHVVECTGVLHHMGDPLAGWRSLRGCLVPGGLMKIGLYSARARRDVAEARRRIAEEGLAPSLRDIRAFRARALGAASGDPLARLAASDDLFTTSACRDLLFHAHEHGFTIAEIADAMTRLELEFVGFDPPDAYWLRRYREHAPADREMTDLASWERFEVDNPDAFAAMYVFWCRAR